MSLSRSTDGENIPATRFGPSALENKRKERLIGATIDGFKVLSLVGEGGFSQVYKVSPEGLNEQHFALKFVPNKAHAPLLEAEAQILAKLKHPNIPTPVRLGSYDGGMYLVMDFIPGTLHQVISDAEKHQLSLTRSLVIIKNLLKILNYAHSRGIVHKDLKPRNIGLDESDNVYLFDFNIAKTLETHQSRAEVENSGLQSGIVEIGGVQKSLLGGTEGYQSPEQRRLDVDGQVHPVTAKSDIYTTGIVLYQLIMGSCPFGAYRKPSEAGHPTWVDSIVDSALQPNPENRSDASDLISRINQALDGDYDQKPIATSTFPIGKVILFPFKILFSPLRLIFWLFGGGLIKSARGHEELAVFITLFLWSSFIWGPPLGYKISRDREIAQSLNDKILPGTLIYIKNQNLGFINAQAALDEGNNPNIIMTHNDVEDLAYLGNHKVGYIYRRSLWVIDLKDGTNKQILATKNSMEDRFISRIESVDGKIYFKISTDRWFSIMPDGKGLAEINILPAFKPKNLSPNGVYQVVKGQLVWNRDRWGSKDLNIGKGKVIWVEEKL